MKEIFRNKSFLLLFLGRIITNIGDSIYYVAAMWLVYDLSGSTFYTGLAGFLILAPKALQFLTGPFVDRWRIKKTLVTTQVLQCVLILIIPISYLGGFLSVPLILILMPIIAMIEEFAYPTQSKALPLILDKEQLVKGNSLFAFAYQGIDIVFNALGGILVALMGAVTLFWIDSITFAITSLLFMFLRTPHTTTVQNLTTKPSIKASVKTYFQQLNEGFSIVFRSLYITILLGAVAANFAIGITMSILPDYANELGGVELYGLLLAAVSAGTLIGALGGGILGKYRVGKSVIICFTAGSLFWFASGFMPWTWLTITMFGIAWIPIGAINVLFMAVTQSVVPNEKLGRISSVIQSVSVVAMPIGSLLGGITADLWGSKIVFTSAPIGVLSMAIIWFILPSLKGLPRADEIDAGTFNLSSTNKEVQETHA